jgi:TonB family protein
MTTLRPLLRLEDKVAAEGRRLAYIGGPPLGHIVPGLIVGVILLHGAVLLLPAVKTRASLPASSPPQDFPLVWRMASPAPRPAPASEGVVAGSPARTTSAPPAAKIAVRPRAMEPVPEPSPELPPTPNSVEVDAVIPPPDAPPPSVEPGAPTSPAAIASAVAPTLLQRVPPVYPVLARALRAEARVTVELTLAADGRVDDAAVLGCSRPGLGFETAALDAVLRWRYESQAPGSAPRTVIVTVEFKRQADRP